MLCVVAETQGSKVGLTTGVLLEDLQHRSLCKTELGFGVAVGSNCIVRPQSHRPCDTGISRCNQSEIESE